MIVSKNIDFKINWLGSEQPFIFIGNYFFQIQMPPWSIKKALVA